MRQPKTVEPCCVRPEGVDQHSIMSWMRQAAHTRSDTVCFIRAQSFDRVEEASEIVTAREQFHIRRWHWAEPCPGCQPQRVWEAMLERARRLWRKVRRRSRRLMRAWVLAKAFRLQQECDVCGGRGKATWSCLVPCFVLDSLDAEMFVDIGRRLHRERPSKDRLAPWFKEREAGRARRAALRTKRRFAAQLRYDSDRWMKDSNYRAWKARIHVGR